MQYELITEDDYDNLPEDSGQKFVALEAVCRRNLNKLILSEGDNEYDTLLRSQYMMTVAAAAEELGVPGIEFPNENRPSDYLNDFMVAVTRAVTKLSLQKSSRRQGSVLIAARTRHPAGCPNSPLADDHSEWRDVGGQAKGAAGAA